MKKFFIAVTCIFLLGITAQGQSNYAFKKDSFFSFQMQFDRVKQAYNQYFAQIENDFTKSNVPFPPKAIYIRSFKYNKILEVWIQLEKQDTFMLYKSFRVCANSGELGPKTREGDFQVPEGAYFIEDFNPKSNYFLSLLVNYPNYFDLQNCYKPNPGGDIYLHGSCTTVGCVPLTDDGIKELYLLCMLAKANGQHNIPVHIFPARYNHESLLYLGKQYKNNKKLLDFWLTLKPLYDYFEKKHTVPFIMYDDTGKYLVESD